MKDRQVSTGRYGGKLCTVEKLCDRCQLLQKHGACEIGYDQDIDEIEKTIKEKQNDT